MHPNEQFLKELYGKFAEGDISGLLAMCDDAVTFEVPGNTPFSGTHTKADFM